MSFSFAVKDEIIGCFEQRQHDHFILLGVGLMVGGRFYNQRITFSTAQLKLAEIMAACFESDLGIRCRMSRGKEQFTLRVTEARDYGIVLRFLKEEFSFELPEGVVGEDWMIARDPQNAGEARVSTVRLIQAAFLAGGSVADPRKSYHLEISVRRSGLAVQLQTLLAEFGIQTALLRRAGYQVLYLKEGEAVSDFLALTGAHVSVLNFENLRLEKDLRNSVNRVVNCDTANSRRIADSSVRQLTCLRKLKEHPLWQTLPQDLQAAGEMRLANPDCSLREMGEMMDPPLGKSGMNHRLKKLERLAEQLDHPESQP